MFWQLLWHQCMMHFQRHIPSDLMYQYDTGWAAQRLDGWTQGERPLPQLWEAPSGRLDTLCKGQPNTQYILGCNIPYRYTVIQSEQPRAWTAGHLVHYRTGGLWPTKNSEIHLYWWKPTVLGVLFVSYLNSTTLSQEELWSVRPIIVGSIKFRPLHKLSEPDKS